jgi:erythromycin esterase
MICGAALVIMGLVITLPVFYGLRLDQLWNLRRLLAEPLQLTPEQQSEVDAWLQTNAMELSTVQPGSPRDDLRRLERLFGDASIVALGEASHVNRTFSQAKHRIIEYLVTELGFSVFAIEATFAGALELNDYLLTGDGEPSRAHAALVYRAWDTESILEMIVWMREYNATHERKLKVYGFDNKPATGSARAVRGYLQTIHATGDYDGVLSVLMDPWNVVQLLKGPKEEIHRAAEQIASLVTELEKAPPSATGTPEPRRQWSLALQHARVLLQNLEFYGAESRSEATDLRDKAMAQNVRWIVEHENQAKTILWAANGHIWAEPGSRSMGEYLRETYGEKFLAVALLANRMPEEGDERALPAEAFVDADGTLETDLTRVGLKIAALDFRSLPPGIVSRYFKAPLITTSGAQIVYPSAYDAVVFMESAITARPVRRPGPAAGMLLANPSNLGFEETDAGFPKDWTMKGGQTRAEYQIDITDEDPFEGRASGVIRRIPGRSFHGSYGNIYQAQKASEFRGGRVRLSAAARATGGTACLYFSVEKTSRFPGALYQARVSSEQWQEYQLEAEVSDRANVISYGLAYTGEGTAYIDSVSIKRVP